MRGAQDLRGPPGREHLRAGLVAAIARGDADQTRRLITEHSLLTASDTDR